MEIKLFRSNFLKDKVENDKNLREAVYYSYNQKKGYGYGIEEIPADDSESFLSDKNSLKSNEQQLSTQVPSDKQIRWNQKKRRLIRNGAVLKLVPYDLGPIHRIRSPIKHVRINNFLFPVNCNIFQDRTAKDQEYFKLVYNSNEYKRVVATKYYKEEECFGIDIEEKYYNEGNSYNLESNEAKYYFDWIYSQGNKDGLILIDAIKYMAKQIKKTNQEELNMENLNELVLFKKFNFKQLDSTTLEWIKTQPYFICVHCINKDHTSNLKEEYFSSNQLELVGLDTSNIDEIHSILKTFKITNAFSTNDFFGSFEYHEMLSNTYGDERYEQYTKCGLEKPHVILQKRSIRLKNINSNEELYKGHFVMWSENWVTFKHKFIKIYLAFVIDEKSK